MEGKKCVKFAFIKFFSIYLGWVSCFYFRKITFFITGQTGQVFNNVTDITLLLRAHLHETRSELKSF